MIWSGSLRPSDEVRLFWEASACGERLLLANWTQEGFQKQATERYRLEPYIARFAEFDRWRGREVLEIGLGLGADHERFALAGASVSGVDLTERAVEFTRLRLSLKGLISRLLVADAEHLPFADGEFDLVYSWGVVHHTLDTESATREILRVLKPGGEFRVMIYHKWSLVGLMLWARYALLRGRPWDSLAEVYSRHLESPGTKAYTVSQARAMFAGAIDLDIRIQLTHGDLLESGAGQRHEGRILQFARRIWPRWLLRQCACRLGLFMLISGRKAPA